MLTSKSMLLKRIGVKSQNPTGKEVLKQFKGILPKFVNASYIDNGDEFVVEETGFFLDEINGYDVPGIVV